MARDIGILKRIVFGGRAQNFYRPLYLQSMVDKLIGVNDAAEEFRGVPGEPQDETVPARRQHQPLQHRRPGRYLLQVHPRVPG